ncbi:MAG: hypothetical protein LBV73_01170 [Paraburkholderia sp.]|jgi:DNA-binding transcriptional LysR family regulator|nr:hypothetical protein [Paraburkholderia sp.]
MFVPQCVMFASNFPVDNLCAALDCIYSGFKAMSRVASPVSTVETSSVLTTLSLPRDANMLAVLPETVAHYYGELNAIAAIATPLRGRLAPYGLIMRKSRRVGPATQLVIDAIHAAS